eukprot:3155444-Pyramimonas_sp.AAC.1
MIGGRGERCTTLGYVGACLTICYYSSKIRLQENVPDLTPVNLDIRPLGASWVPLRGLLGRLG